MYRQNYISIRIFIKLLFLIIIIVIIIIIIFFFFFHGLARLTSSDIDAMPSFPGAFTSSSSPRFVVEGVFRESGVVHYHLIRRYPKLCFFACEFFIFF
jgi:hypothetical protein